MDGRYDDAKARRAGFSASLWANRLVPAAVLVIGIVISVIVSRSAREETRRDAEDRLATTGSTAAMQIERRFAAYFSVLAGTRALFHTVDNCRARISTAMRSHWRSSATFPASIS